MKAMGFFLCISNSRKDNIFLTNYKHIQPILTAGHLIIY